MESKDLTVRIESEGGALTLTPLGLLQHFLPGAKALPNGRVFAGHPPGRSDVTVYVNVEALAGMLMEAREKHINPIAGMYLIPSNHPDKPAGCKIKYDVGIQRARKIPGFMGLNMGLLVKRGNDIKETSGETPMPGDVIYGAWAELYIASLPRPLRKEVPASVKGLSDAWKKHEGFMYCKVAVDRLLRLNFPSLYADEAQEAPATEENDIVLEASAPGVYSSPPPTPFEFKPEVPYVGAIAKLLPSETTEKDGKKQKKPGLIAITTEHGELAAFFWERPESLKKIDNWGLLIGQPAQLSFTTKPDKSGKVFWYVKEFSYAPEVDQDAPGDATEPEEEGEAA